MWDVLGRLEGGFLDMVGRFGGHVWEAAGAMLGGLLDAFGGKYAYFESGTYSNVSNNSFLV